MQLDLGKPTSGLWPADDLPDGKCLSLEFANSLSWRGRPEPTESLKAPEDWLDWMSENEALPKEAIAELRRRAGMWHSEAEKGLARAIEFRESLYNLLESHSEGKSPANHDVSAFTAVLETAMEGLRLDPADGQWVWRLDNSPLDWEAPLRPAALSAAQLLTSGFAARVRGCGRDECRWLFLDLTKNNSRKWCDMSTCGNVLKARRNYAKKRLSSAKST